MFGWEKGGPGCTRMELGMTQRDRDRLRVMAQLEHQQITQTQAGRLLGLSERQVRRIYRRWRAESDWGLRHRSRGEYRFHVRMPE